ncbi:hypothetical protein BGZ88_009446 [Linnemannia elongata]|nr:hypothetical protein BGZ88_009446 [Linnemannia elongata]
MYAHTRTNSPSRRSFPTPPSYRCWRVHDKYLCSKDKKHFEEFHVYYQKCNSCPHDRAHCGNLIMEREASKLFPWRCNVCAQTEFLDKTGRYKTEDFSRW